MQPKAPGSGEALLALADRCEAASGAGRELDAEIAAATRSGLPHGCDWARKFPNWEGERNGHVRVVGNVNGNCDYTSGRFEAPRYTASLDAALTLVPPGWFTLMAMEDRHSHSWRWDLRGGFGVEVGARAATPALALCAAALDALSRQPNP